MKPEVPAQPVRLREDLIHPDPLLDSLVEVCRFHGRGATRASLAAVEAAEGRLDVEALVASAVDATVLEAFKFPSGQISEGQVKT